MSEAVEIMTHRDKKVLIEDGTPYIVPDGKFIQVGNDYAWLTPDRAAEAARALLGEEMVVVRREDLNEVLNPTHGSASAPWAVALGRLRAVLGPEPCPSKIRNTLDKWGYCTHPDGKGHDGDHVAPKEAWTNG